MSADVIEFGDAFRYQEREYVFLGITPEKIYAALILTQGQTQMVMDRYKNDSHTGGAKRLRIESNSLYYFVELKTEDFRGRIAHLVKSDHDVGSLSIDYICALTEEDQGDLRKEILREGSPAPKELKEMIRPQE